MFWFQKLTDHQFGLIFFPLKYTHKYNCCLVIKPLCSRLQGHHAAALHKPNARWGGCVFTVFLRAVDRVCVHYTVSCCCCHHCDRGEAGVGGVTPPRCTKSTCASRRTGQIALICAVCIIRSIARTLR